MLPVFAAVSGWTRASCCAAALAHLAAFCPHLSACSPWLRDVFAHPWALDGVLRWSLRWTLPQNTSQLMMSMSLAGTRLLLMAGSPLPLCLRVPRPLLDSIGLSSAKPLRMQSTSRHLAIALVGFQRCRSSLRQSRPAVTVHCPGRALCLHL